MKPRRLVRFAAVALAALVSATPAAAAKKPLAAGDRVDLNRATVGELMRLPGIGRKKAEAIVARRARAPFRRVDDLVAVKGISAAWLARHRTHLTLSASGAAPAPERGAGHVPTRGGGSAATGPAHSATP